MTLPFNLKGHDLERSSWQGSLIPQLSDDLDLDPLAKPEVGETGEFDKQLQQISTANVRTSKPVNPKPVNIGMLNKTETSPPLSREINFLNNATTLQWKPSKGPILCFKGCRVHFQPLFTPGTQIEQVYLVKCQLFVYILSRSWSVSQSCPILTFEVSIQGFSRLPSPNPTSVLTSVASVDLDLDFDLNFAIWTCTQGFLRVPSPNPTSVLTSVASVDLDLDFDLNFATWTCNQGFLRVPSPNPTSVLTSVPSVDLDLDFDLNFAKWACTQGFLRVPSPFPVSNLLCDGFGHHYPRVLTLDFGHETYGAYTEDQSKIFKAYLLFLNQLY